MTDTLFLGGESLAVLALAQHIPEHIHEVYASAYPNGAENFSLSEKIRSLDGDELAGFVAGVKGKMFEQQCVEYLNEGNLPDGDTAVLASSPNQPDWDIRIDGPNDELVEVMQATDSMAYIADELRKNPAIDVVTTEEVYSHLVMSGVSEGIVNNAITNDSLESALDSAIESADVKMNWAPPWFTLGLIAFTSYKDESDDLRKYLPVMAAASIAYVGETTERQEEIKLKGTDSGISFVKEGM